MILAPTYAEDGLISQHVVEFMSDPRFTEAYEWASRGLPTDTVHPRFRAYTACWAAEQALGLDGDFVECGVGPSLFSGSIVKYLNFAHSSKTLYLYDTFHGVPVETLSDPDEIATLTAFNAAHYATDLLASTREKFKDYPNVKIFPGIVPQSLHGTAPDKIAYLSIDMNNATAEIGAIEFLWDRIVPGGIVLLDDYAYGPEFMGQKRAWDEFAAKKGFPILTMATGHGLIIKR